MSDLIKREDAIKAVEREKSDWNCDYNVPIDNCIKRLKKVKSADRPQGEWIVHGEAPIYVKECSVCGAKFFHHATEDLTPFCAMCGAKMKGVDDGNK